jgi:hypothetical protein
MKGVSIVSAWLIGVYLVARALIEPFTIDIGDPVTYRDDWGGPSLTGVLMVHMVPGLLAAALMTASILRRHRAG